MSPLQFLIALAAGACGFLLWTETEKTLAFITLVWVAIIVGCVLIYFLVCLVQGDWIPLTVFLEVQNES